MIAVALMFLAAVQAASDANSTARSASEIANSTKFDVTYSGGNVTSCTITATSGYAQVDRYVCDAARSCGDQYANADRRAACLATKRQELTDQIAKALGASK